MYVDKKIMGILALSLLAVALVLGSFVTRPARADNVISERGYQLITAASPNGGDNLYIFDSGSGILAVFVYDPTTHSMRPKAFLPVQNLFGAR
jgi:hypothetical protein